MPPIDASIIAGLQPAQIQQQDPLQVYAKSMTLRNLMQQGQLQGIQTQSAQEALDSNHRVRALFANNPNPTVEQVMGADPKYGINYQKAQLEAKMNQSTIDKNTASIPKLQAEGVLSAADVHRAALDNAKDYAGAVQWVKDGYSNPTLAPALVGTAEQAISMIPTDPAGFAQWRQEQALGAKKFIELNKPTIHTTSNGQVQTTQAYPGLGGAPTTLSTTQMQQTPDSIASQSTAVRGQNMTDTRARELNGIMANGMPNHTVETAAKAIADGRLPALSGFAMKTPWGQQVTARVMELNPNYSGKDYQVGLTGEKYFTSGKGGQSVKSFNVSLDHLDTLSNLSDALQNGNMQLFNKIGNEFATQTGSPAPVDFNAAKKIVGDEIVKAVVGAGGTGGDREEAARAISSASSPAQLKGVINTYKKLMNGQLNGLRQQYESSTGKNDFDKFLSPAARAAATSAQPATATVPAGSVPIKISGDDGYNALPKGAHYVGPDGVERVK